MLPWVSKSGAAALGLPSSALPNGWHAMSHNDPHGDMRDVEAIPPHFSHPYDAKSYLRRWFETI